MRHIDDRERRARLATRQGLVSDRRAADAVTGARAVGFLHATEQANVYLSLAARADVTREDIDRALYDDRTLVRQLAMRRTLFVVPRELFPAVRGSAAARVAGQQQARLAKDVEAGQIAANGPRWVTEVSAKVRRAVVDQPRTTTELRQVVPELDERIDVSVGKSYGGNFAIASRVLTAVAADGSVVRGRNGGGWKVARPYWTAVEQWLGKDPGALDPHDGYREVVRVWLERFGPGTEDDIVWWLGATRAAVRRALTDLEAVQVGLDGGDTGWVLPGDVEPVDAPAHHVTLLPVLDPSTMGWKSRDFYLGSHASEIVDRNGNAGATAWVDGRVVGTWTQSDDGSVVVLPLEELAPVDHEALYWEARRLTAWLDGDVVRSIYTSPAAREWARAAGAWKFPVIR